MAEPVTAGRSGAVGAGSGAATGNSDAAVGGEVADSGTATADTGVVGCSGGSFGGPQPAAGRTETPSDARRWPSSGGADAGAGVDDGVVTLLRVTSHTLSVCLAQRRNRRIQLTPPEVMPIGEARSDLPA